MIVTSWAVLRGRVSPVAVLADGGPGEAAVVARDMRESGHPRAAGATFMASRGPAGRDRISQANATGEAV